MGFFIKVAESQDEEAIEIPAEEDGSLLLSTLTAQFPGAVGLKFWNEESSSWRGVRASPEGFLTPDDFWQHQLYIVVYPKENKRKYEENVDNSTSKTKKLHKIKCSDLVVLGIPYSFTSKDLHDYFSAFGELSLCEVKVKHDGDSKGFGFIRFDDYESQRKALGQQHLLGKRRCEVKFPNSKNTQGGEFYKLYVGHISKETTSQQLKEFFESYGDVEEVYIPMSPFRHCAFITFKHGDVAPGLVNQQFEIADGVKVVTNNADPKGTASGKQQPQQQQGGRWGVQPGGRQGGLMGPMMGNPMSTGGPGGYYSGPQPPAFSTGGGSGYGSQLSSQGAMGGYHATNFNQPPPSMSRNPYGGTSFSYDGVNVASQMPSHQQPPQQTPQAPPPSSQPTADANVANMVAQLTQQVASNPQVLQHLQALLTLTAGGGQPQQQQGVSTAGSFSRLSGGAPSSNGDVKMDESDGGSAKWGGGDHTGWNQ